MTDHQMRAAIEIAEIVLADPMEEAALILAEALRLKAERMRARRDRLAAQRQAAETENAT